MEKVLVLLRPVANRVSAAVGHWNEHGFILIQPYLWRKRYLYNLLLLSTLVLVVIFITVQTLKLSANKGGGVVAESTLVSIKQSEVCMKTDAGNTVFMGKRLEERVLVICSKTGQHYLINTNVNGCFKKISSSEVTSVDPEECKKRLQ